MKHLLMSFLVGTMILLSACSDEDGPKTNEIPDRVLEAFNSQYPNATNVSWETRDEYAVASFTIEVRSTTTEGRSMAWYRMSDARWSMSDIDIHYNHLPQAVKTSFEATEYAQAPWHRDDDVDVITRAGYDETLYVIEVEKNENGIETEVELYYTADGILVNTIIEADKEDDHSHLLPSESPSGITEWLNQHFPGARIIEIDRENGGTEVDLIYNGKKHEVVFSSSSQWIYTKTEYDRRDIGQIEQAVMAALKTSEHYTSDNRIDDIDRYETATGETFYCFELETRFDDDIEVYISIDGEILPGRPSLGTSGGGAAVNSDIEAFIAERYPGATIIEKDNDDGYIEVEILHDGLEKEVVFNGRNEWIRTEWEIHRNQLPAEVIEVIEKAGYSSRHIDDDIDVIETDAGLKYEVEIEDGHTDIKLIITNGTITDILRD